MHKVTFILKDKTDYFFNQLSQKTPEDAYSFLKKSDGVKVKIGNGSFQEGLDFNVFVKTVPHKIESKLDHRKGYKLATFIFSKGE